MKYQRFQNVVLRQGMWQCKPGFSRTIFSSESTLLIFCLNLICSGRNIKEKRKKSQVKNRAVQSVDQGRVSCIRCTQCRRESMPLLLLANPVACLRLKWISLVQIDRVDMPRDKLRPVVISIVKKHWDAFDYGRYLQFKFRDGVVCKPRCIMNYSQLP